jgi:replicative DNA helicase
MPAEQQYDALAEQAVLATIFTNPEMLDDLHDIIQPSDFFEERNKIIFEAAITLQENGKSYDPINLAGALKRQDLINSIGGIGYITELFSPNSLTQYSSDPIGYAEIVQDLSRRRQMLDIATSMEETASLGSGFTSGEALMIAEESILQLSQQETSSRPESASEMFDGAVQRMEEAALIPEGSTPGIPTGFTMLDDMTGGWLPGQVIALAARPSVGKTALAMDFARGAAYLGGKSVLFFSLEMSGPELMMRLISAEARVQLQNIKKGTLTAEERMFLKNVEPKIKENNLFFDSSPEVGLSHIRSRAVRQKFSPAGLDLIIVDYLGLMKVPENNKNYNRENQVAALSRGIKLLAKEMGIPIILLAQLNRQSESRIDKKPALSDLRESGSIEQDVDIALLIHRPDQSDPNIRPGEADLLVVKNRNGPTGKIPLVPMLEFGKYVQGDGLIQPDLGHYDDAETVANAGEGQVVYPAPSEEDDAPW